MVCDTCVSTFANQDQGASPMYWSKTSKTCLPCLPAGLCSACSATGVCQNCTEGYQLVGSKCVKECEASDDGPCLQCAEDKTKCAVCSVGRALNSTGACVPCVTGTSSWRCDACAFQGTTNVCTSCVNKNSSIAMFFDTPSKACVSCPQPGICKICTSATTCSACNTGYALVNGVCVKLCQSSASGPCLTCSTSDVTKCGSCVSRKGLDATGTNCVDCPSKPSANWFCDKCQYDSSINAQKCLQCNATTSAPAGPIAMYWQSSSKSCAQCSQPGICTACNSNGVCTACPTSSYRLLGSTCVKLCVQQAAGPCTRCSTADTTKCLNCAAGFALSSGSCQACPANCTACTLSGSVFTCTACSFTTADGTRVAMYWNQGTKKCTECPSPGLCNSCSSTGQCNGCITGYSLSAGACFRNCQTNTDCTTCSTTDRTKCSRCASGKGLDAAQRSCVNCPSPSTATDRWSCAACAYDDALGSQACSQCRSTSTPAVPLFFNRTARACQRCPQPGVCNACNGDGACTACATGWRLVSGVCIKGCPPDICTTCNNNRCTRCAAGYYLDSNSFCQACLGSVQDASCTQCGSTGVCTACSNEFPVNRNKKCTACTDATRCAKCPNNINTCTACKPRWRLLSGRCA